MSKIHLSLVSTIGGRCFWNFQIGWQTLVLDGYMYMSKWPNINLGTCLVLRQADLEPGLPLIAQDPIYLVNPKIV